MTQQDEFVEFAEYVVDEESWYLMAGELVSAAQALEPAIEEYWRFAARQEEARKEGRIVLRVGADQRGVYFMLMAFALENVCKGYLIGSDIDGVREAVQRHGRIPKSICRGHDLTRLLEEIGFPVTADDRELAFRLERSAVWSGRYPTPRAAIHRTVTFKTEEGEETIPTWHSPDDVAAVKDLGARVSQFVEAARGGRPLHSFDPREIS